MRVLVLGATGKLGSRVLSALIQNEHSVFAFVRNASKLAPGVRERLSGLEEGDARTAADIKSAVTRNRCDAIVNTAGLAAMAPWGKSDLPTIVDAVVCAALEIGSEHGSPLRLWVLAGQSLLDVPMTKYRIVDYVGVFPEHRHTWSKLQAIPPSAIDWSILCPGVMQPLSKTTYPLAANSSAENLQASSGSPPDWSPRLLCIPFIGGYLNIMSQASTYGTALEDNVDFIAKDLLDGNQSKWIGQKVGVKQRRSS